MPIYEFYCPDNHKIYSFFARSLSYSAKTPRCPDNPKHRMEKMISIFAVTGRAKEKPDASGGPDMDDPRMESVMAEMEREMGGMDTENPDPRQLARMMRKVSALTGEKMPAQMEEMIQRMELGEDPEKLEEEYGDVVDESDGFGEGGPDDAPGAELKAGLRRLRRRAVRDPSLYEMSEFVD